MKFDSQCSPVNDKRAVLAEDCDLDAQLTSFCCLMEKEHLCVQFPHWSVPFLVSDRMSQTRIRTCVCVVVGSEAQNRGRCWLIDDISAVTGLARPSCG